MSARTPFVPFSDQPKSTLSSSAVIDGPTLMPNLGNALHRGSGQTKPDTENTPLGLDINKHLPLAGLLGQRPNRTASHGSSASNDLLQMAAATTLKRPQTTVPGQGNRGESAGSKTKPGMLLNNRTNTDNSFERIVSPVPINVAQQNQSILTSPSIGFFKMPALPPQVDSTSPDRSLGFSNAHISNNMHPQQQNADGHVRQQPSPDPSNQSASSDEQVHAVGVSGSFRTSTPLDRSHRRDASAIRARRVFQQSYGHDHQDDRSAYYGHMPVGDNRRHSREYHPDEDDQTEPPPKRRKGSREPQSRVVARHSAPLDGEDALNDLSFQQYRDHASANAPSHECVLGQILSCDADQLLRNQVEHFGNRFLIWQAASDDEWKDGAEELRQKFDNMLKKAQDHMEKKQDLIATLENRIAERQEYLREREEALMVARENLVSESQNVLGGKFSG